MWQVEVGGKRKLFREKEELLQYLYEEEWERAKVMCVECGEYVETEEEVNVFAFVERHHGHFGTLIDLERVFFFSHTHSLTFMCVLIYRVLFLCSIDICIIDRIRAVFGNR